MTDQSGFLDLSTHLIAERNSKAREILRWRGKDVIFRLAEGSNIIVGGTLYRGSSFCRVLDCNQFIVTLQFGSNEKTNRAYSLAFIEIGYDCEHDHLELIEIPTLSTGRSVVSF